MYELWNDSATPKFYVGITGEGVRFARTAPRIDGHSSTSFQGLGAMDARYPGRRYLAPTRRPVGQASSLDRENARLSHEPHRVGWVDENGGCKVGACARRRRVVPCGAADALPAHHALGYAGGRPRFPTPAREIEGVVATGTGDSPGWAVADLDEAMDLGNRAYRSSSLTVTVTRP